MIPTDYQQFVESTSKYIFELGIAKKDTEAICSAVIANIIASSMNNNMQKKEIIKPYKITLNGLLFIRNCLSIDRPA